MNSCVSRFLVVALAIAAATAFGLLAGCGGDSEPSRSGDADRVVNVYTARHYDTDDAVYERFTELTGVRVNIIEGNADQLIARIEREGELSPADVLIAVDAARLHRAEEKGIFQATESPVLSDRIRASRRHPEGLWFGLTERARVIVVSDDRVRPGEVTSYADLADERFRGRVLVRSSSHVYNQSLVASLIERVGAEATEAWASGLAANLARTPQGGDRDQIRAVAAGEGDIAIVNHYYLARMLEGGEADRAAAGAVRIVFPDQDDRGTHVNICGVGVVRGAPNREHAIRLIEFLASGEAQGAFAAGNYEYPVIDDQPLEGVLAGFGDFIADEVNVAALGANNAEAVRIMDRVGWR